jgi:hypothetical protein
MLTEQTEDRRTKSALKKVLTYIRPGTNEGISFSLSRLTDDLFTDSFLAGGDISLFTPSGSQGSIRSQLSSGWVLSSTAGPPTQFPIDLRINLGTGMAKGSWTLPDGTAQSPSFRVQHVKTTSPPEGTQIVFAGETSSDGAVYSIALLLI